MPPSRAHLSASLPSPRRSPRHRLGDTAHHHLCADPMAGRAQEAGRGSCSPGTQTHAVLRPERQQLPPPGRGGARNMAHTHIDPHSILTLLPGNLSVGQGLLLPYTLCVRGPRLREKMRMAPGHTAPKWRGCQHLCETQPHCECRDSPQRPNSGATPHLRPRGFRPITMSRTDHPGTKNPP